MKGKIEEYIKNLAAEKNIIANNSTDLFAEGVLDSLGMVLLLMFIDEKLGIQLNIETLDINEFKTIDAIVELLS